MASEPGGGRPLKILMVAAEAAPFAKVGGLADVAGALPLVLTALGQEVRVVMPKYAQIDAARFNLQPAIPHLPVPWGTGEGRPAPAGETPGAGTETVEVLAGSIGPAGTIPVYFIADERLFGRPEVYGYPDDDERFLLFCRAALEMLPALDWWPDVIHCNDWHSGVIPNWLQTLYAHDPRYARIATVYTIHNLAYQGVFGQATLERAGLAAGGPIPAETAYFGGAVNLMARGLLYADAINTVSEQYAREILTPEYGERLDPLLREREAQVFGILNGIHTDVVDPRTDPHLVQNFDADHLEARAVNKAALQREARLPGRPEVPVLSAISRLATQKGFDIMVPMLEALLARHDVQFVLLATGDPGYEAQFSDMARRYPNKVTFFRAFDAEIGQHIYSGSDMFLMPSRFEPCGLGQLFAMRYGSVPIVRHTGGLVDTVQDYDPATGQGSGFVFTEYDPAAFGAATERALALYADPVAWRRLVRYDMGLDWSWRVSARKYVDLYRRAMVFHSEKGGRSGPPSK